MQIRHFSYEGEHYYRLFDNTRELNYKGDLDLYLADGQGLGGYLERMAPRQVIKYVVIDHAVSVWNKRQFHHEAKYVRTERENPFKFDLPDEFASEEELTAWWVENSGQEYCWEVVCAYYQRESKSTEIEPLPLEVETLELGEYAPAPAVSFAWSSDSLVAHREAEELLHLYPCRASGETVKQAVRKWLIEESNALGVREHYLDQSGCSIYFVDKSHISVGRFFEQVKGANLWELNDAVTARIEEAKAYIRSMAATAKCPYCAGSGRRMEDAAREPLGEEIVAEVQRLRTTKTGVRCSRIIDMVRRLAQTPAAHG